MYRDPLNPPVINFHDANLEEVLTWLERVKYRALVREGKELARLGYKVFTVQLDKWSYPETGQWIKKTSTQTGRVQELFMRYGRGENRRAGDIWHNKKDGVEYELRMPYRFLGFVCDEFDGTNKAFLVEDIDITSIVPDAKELAAIVKDAKQI